MEGLNKLGGRFQTRHLFHVQTATFDAKGSTGLVAALLFSVPYARIELLSIGYIVMATGGALTIPFQMRLDYITRLGGATVNGLAALYDTAGYNGLATGVSTMTYAGGATAPVGTSLEQSLNPFATGIVPTSVNPTGLNPTPGQPTYFQAYRGDLLQWNLTVAGTGAGAQTVRPFIVYREVPLT